MIYNSDDENKDLSFQYRFIFGRGLERKIDIKLDKKPSI